MKKPTLAEQLAGANEYIAELSRENQKLKDLVALADSNTSHFQEQLRSYDNLHQEHIAAIEELKQQHAQKLEDEQRVSGELRKALSRAQGVADDWAIRVQRTEHWLDTTERYNRKLQERNGKLKAELDLTLRAVNYPIRTMADYIRGRISIDTVFLGPVPRHDPHIEELDGELRFTNQPPQRA